MKDRSISQVNSVDLDRLGLKNSKKYAEPQKYNETLQHNLDVAT